MKTPTPTESRKECVDKLAISLSSFDAARQFYASAEPNSPAERAGALVLKQMANEVSGRAHALAESIQKASE